MRKYLALRIFSACENCGRASMCRPVLLRGMLSLFCLKCRLNEFWLKGLSTWMLT